MSDVIEIASSGRAKCRACGRAIAKGELRFGERMPNPFGEGEATYWFHVRCGACKRPEPTLAALEAAPDGTEDRDELLEIARRGVARPKLARFATVERAPSGRARCRQCREPIAKEGWRIALDWWEEGRFGGSGFIHLACAAEFFGTTEDLEMRVRWFAPDLDELEVDEVLAAVGA